MAVHKASRSASKSGRKSSKASKKAGVKSASKSTAFRPKVKKIAVTFDYRNKPYFKTPKVLTAPRLSLATLVDATTVPDRRTAASVRLKTLKPIKNRFPKNRYLKTFKAFRATTHTTENSHEHEVIFHYMPDDNGNFSMANPVVVSCTCARHKFRWEYALAKQGASYIYYSNGEPPVDGSYIGLCKHALRAASYVLKKWKHSGDKTKKVPLPAGVKVKPTTRGKAAHEVAPVPKIVLKQQAKTSGGVKKGKR